MDIPTTSSTSYVHDRDGLEYRIDVWLGRISREMEPSAPPGTGDAKRGDGLSAGFLRACVSNRRELMRTVNMGNVSGRAKCPIHVHRIRRGRGSMRKDHLCSTRSNGPSSGPCAVAGDFLWTASVEKWKMLYPWVSRRRSGRQPSMPSDISITKQQSRAYGPEEDMETPFL